MYVTKPNQNTHFTWYFYWFLFDILPKRWSNLTPFLHCKIRSCFFNFFQLYLRLLYRKLNTFHQSGYIQHIKWFLTKNIQISKLDQFLGFILKIPLSTHLTNPMVATSVVTYTFYMGQIWWRPWSGWGTSVDWGGLCGTKVR